MFKKRFFAYVLDLIFIMGIILVVTSFVPKSKQTMELQSSIDEISEELASHEIGKLEYYDKYTYLEKDYDKSMEFQSILNVLLIIAYYILIPAALKGQTIGKYITGIKIVNYEDKKPSLMVFFIREAIINGLFYLILVILAFNYVPGAYYLSFVSILAIIQIIVVIISGFMIKYKGNCLGLHDLVTKTKVVDAK